MKKSIKSAIQYGDDYYKDLICACCDISDRHKEYIKMANNSLKSWDEVLQELEEKKEQESSAIIIDYEWKRALDMCIDIINQKLEQIEE